MRRGVFAILALSMLVGCLSGNTFAGESWVGKMVMPKADCKATLDGKDISLQSIRCPFLVQDVDGDNLWIGRAWIRSKYVIKLEDAPSYYSDFIRNKPNSSWGRSMYGLALEKNGDHDKAREEYTEAIRLDPGNANAYNSRGTLWLRKKILDKALEDFSKAISIDSKFALAYNNRGVVWEEKKELDKAMKDYTEAIRSNPKLALAYANRAILWEKKKELDKAITDYSKAIDLDPQYARAYVNRARAYDMKGEIENALTDYADALRLDPKNPVTFRKRAMLWEVKREYANALEDYAEAIRLEPQNGSNYNLRAWLLATCPDDRFRNGQQAVTDATKACKLAEWKEARYCDTLAAAYAETGDFNSAVKWSNKALELGPKKPDTAQDFTNRLSHYKESKPYRHQRKQVVVSGKKNEGP